MSEYVIRIYNDGSTTAADPRERFMEMKVRPVPARLAQDYAFNVHDLAPIADEDAPEDDDKIREQKRARRAERHERLWQHHFAAYLQLTGREPSERQQWDSYAVFAQGYTAGFRECQEHYGMTPLARDRVSDEDICVMRSEAYQAQADAQGWRQGKEQGLTAEERQLLRGFNSRIKAGEVTATPNEWNLIVDALDKLLALQGER